MRHPGDDPVFPPAHTFGEGPIAHPAQPTSVPTQPGILISSSGSVPYLPPPASAIYSAMPLPPTPHSFPAVPTRPTVVDPRVRVAQGLTKAVLGRSATPSGDHPTRTQINKPAQPGHSAVCVPTIRLSQQHSWASSSGSYQEEASLPSASSLLELTYAYLGNVHPYPGDPRSRDSVVSTNSAPAFLQDTRRQSDVLSIGFPPAATENDLRFLVDAGRPVSNAPAFSSSKQLALTVSSMGPIHSALSGLTLNPSQPPYRSFAPSGEPMVVNITDDLSKSTAKPGASGSPPHAEDPVDDVEEDDDDDGEDEGEGDDDDEDRPGSSVMAPSSRTSRGPRIPSHLQGPEFARLNRGCYAIEGPRCPHATHWKRLRAKRGFTYFVCFQCGVKWRLRSSSGGEGPSAQAQAAQQHFLNVGPNSVTSSARTPGLTPTSTQLGALSSRNGSLEGAMITDYLRRVSTTSALAMGNSSSHPQSYGWAPIPFSVGTETVSGVSSGTARNPFVEK